MVLRELPVSPLPYRVIRAGGAKLREGVGMDRYVMFVRLLCMHVCMYVCMFVCIGASLECAIGCICYFDCT